MDINVDSVATLLGGAGAIFSAVKAFKFVKEGERGVLLTLGKAKRRKGEVKIIKPGFVFQIPFVQHIEKIHITKNTQSFIDLVITLPTGLSYYYNAFIVYHIRDEASAIENVLFTIEDLDEFVKAYTEKAIQEVMQTTQVLDTNVITSRIKRKVSPFLRVNGIDVDSIGIVSFAETNISQNLRGLSYKIDLALQHKGQLDGQLLSACLGAMPTVDVNTQAHVVQQPVQHEQQEDNEHIKINIPTRRRE